jgi:hypothetical protein
MPTTSRIEQLFTRDEMWFRERGEPILAKRAHGKESDDWVRTKLLALFVGHARVKDMIVSVELGEGFGGASLATISATISGRTETVMEIAG